MTLEELYEHFDFSWRKVSIGIGCGSNSLALWRKKGGISYNYQLLIEKRTNGKFKADKKQ